MHLIALIVILIFSIPLSGLVANAADSSVEQFLIKRMISDYEKKRVEMKRNLGLTQKVSFRWEHLDTTVKLTTINALTQELTNPTSEVLGASYTSIVQQFAENIREPMKEDTGNRFGKILTYLVDGESSSVARLIGSNPIGALVQEIGSMALQFLEVSGFPGRAERAVGNEVIAKFYLNTGPYVSFYDQLFSGQKRLTKDILISKEMAASLGVKLSTFKNDIGTKFQIHFDNPDKDPTEAFEERYPDIKNLTVLDEIVTKLDDKNFNELEKLLAQAKNFEIQVQVGQFQVYETIIRNLKTISAGLQNALAIAKKQDATTNKISLNKDKIKSKIIAVTGHINDIEAKMKNGPKIVPQNNRTLSIENEGFRSYW